MGASAVTAAAPTLLSKWGDQRDPSNPRCLWLPSLPWPLAGLRFRYWTVILAFGLGLGSGRLGLSRLASLPHVEMNLPILTDDWTDAL